MDAALWKGRSCEVVVDVSVELPQSGVSRLIMHPNWEYIFSIGYFIIYFGNRSILHAVRVMVYTMCFGAIKYAAIQTRNTGVSPVSSCLISALGSFTCITWHRGPTALRPSRRTQQRVLLNDTGVITGTRTHTLLNRNIPSYPLIRFQFEAIHPDPIGEGWYIYPNVDILVPNQYQNSFLVSRVVVQIPQFDMVYLNMGILGSRMGYPFV